MIKHLIAFCLTLTMTGVSEAAYTYYRSITIDHTKCGGTDSVNFPILVCANGTSPCNTSVAGLNQSGAGAHVQNSNGYDIGFFKDNSCSTKVTGWEVQHYVASTGELTAWVNVDTVSHSSDTTIYMCYDDGTISTYQSTVANTWDSNFQIVTHYTFDGGSTLSSLDSKTGGNARSGRVTAATGGPFGAGYAAYSATAYYAYDGVSSSEDIGRAANADLTISAWVKKDDAASADQINLYLTLNGVSREMWICPYSDHNFYWDDFGASNGRVFADFTSYENNWTWVTTTSKADNSFGSLNFNGIDKATRTVGEVTSTALDGFIFLYPTANAFNAAELRVSKTVRSADWSLKEFNGMNSPSTFITFGAETAVGGGGGATSSASKMKKLQKLDAI